MEEIFNLENILLQKGGFFGITPKLPIKSKSTLGMIYTPGVGKICMELKEDPEKAMTLTNKANNMFVITDSSGFSDYNKSKWNNDQVIPYLESKTLYYKCTTNIDCYPLIMDHATTNTAQEIHDILDNMSPAYTACELFKISSERQEDLKKLLAKKPVELVIIMDDQRTYISEKIKTLQCCEFSENFAISAIMRALIDQRAYGVVTNDLISYCLEEINKEFDTCNTEQYLKILVALNQATANYCADKLGKSDKVEATTQRLKDFLVYGSVHRDQQNYLYHDHTNDENAMYLHEVFNGVVECKPTIRMLDPRHLDKVLSDENLAKVSKKIQSDPIAAEFMTCKKNFCAIISEGSAVLGLGNIGGLASLPVMEGKSVLFKEFGNADVMPICFKEQSKEKVAEMICRISPIFGAINLEDISGRTCFWIENYCKKNAFCPIFHDDQHGTAIVVLAGLINCLKLMDKKPNEIKIVINGVGAAGTSICELLLKHGVKNIICVDTKGAIYRGREEGMNDQKREISNLTNFDDERGNLEDVIKGAHVFIGCSVAGALSKELVYKMAQNPVIFALANPVPEIYPSEAKEAGAFIVATGRSDFPNQINNSLAFPGIFRAILDVRASEVTIEMKVAASHAIANMIGPSQLNPGMIMPDPLDYDIPVLVAAAVAKVAIEQGKIQKNLKCATGDLKAYFKRYSINK